MGTSMHSKRYLLENPYLIILFWIRPIHLKIEAKVTSGAVLNSIFEHLKRPKFLKFTFL